MILLKIGSVTLSYVQQHAHLQDEIILLGLRYDRYVTVRSVHFYVPKTFCGVLERGTDARCCVASPMPSSEAIARRESP